MEEKIAEGFKGERAIILPYTIRTYQAQNDITRQLYITHIGYYPHARYHFRERQAGTNQYVFLFCAEGKGWIIYNEERMVLERNQAFLLPAGEPHAYGADKANPWSLYWIHFLGEKADLFSPIMRKIIDTHDSDNSRSEDRLLLFEEMYQNLEMGYSPDNLEYVSFCLMHFLASFKYLSQFGEVKNVKEVDAIQKGILFMKDHLETKITLGDIARHAGYSSSHYGSLFLEKTSYSPIEYYNQLKIQRACSYLQFSDFKVKEIAFRLGYFDPFHFSHAFRKEMNMSPKEYRRKYNP